MKGIVITSHGPMAQGILETSKLFMGDQPQLVSRCLNADDNPDDFVESLKEAINEVDSGEGVIVMCDMLFGTPCNCMTRIVAEDLESDKIQVVTGVNLAMVLQALATREAMDPTVDDLMTNGKDGIVDLVATIKASM